MEGDNKIVRAITSVTCVMLLVKVLAMVRNILQARVYGAGPDVDMFTLANNYSISLFSTVCYALCVAAIPIFSQKLMKDREDCCRAADRLISNTMVLSLVLLVLLLTLGASGAVETVLGISENSDLFRSYFLMLVPALPVVTLTYLLLALFQSMGHFTLQGSLSFLYNIVLCGVLLIAGDRLGLSGFVFLTSACWLLQLAMTFPAIRKERYRFRFSLNLREREYWTFLRTSAATMFNSALFLMCYLINTQFAASAADGTISAFFYANRLYEPLTTTLIYSISIVMFPTFSQKYEQMAAGEYRQYVVYVVKNTVLLILPISLLFSVFGTPIIRVLFEGGSFTAQDTLVCGGIFSMYALGMAGFFILDLLNKAYYAMGKTLIPICITSLVLVVCGLSNALFSRMMPDTPQMLALGTAIGFLLGGVVVYLGFARIEGVKMPVKQLFWGILFSLLMGAGVWFVYERFIAATMSKLILVLQCGALGVVGMLLYLVLMGPMVPTHEILSKLRRKKP